MSNTFDLRAGESICAGDFCVIEDGLVTKAGDRTATCIAAVSAAEDDVVTVITRFHECVNRQCSAIGRIKRLDQCVVVGRELSIPLIRRIVPGEIPNVTAYVTCEARRAAHHSRPAPRAFLLSTHHSRGESP